jgi:hypothetical protein
MGLFFVLTAVYRNGSAEKREIKQCCSESGNQRSASEKGRESFILTSGTEPKY